MTMVQIAWARMRMVKVMGMARKPASTLEEASSSLAAAVATAVAAAPRSEMMTMRRKLMNSATVLKMPMTIQAVKRHVF